ncbi:hypothetical protein ABZP36_014583 [Zizania latifolia]
MPPLAPPYDDDDLFFRRLEEGLAGGDLTQSQSELNAFRYFMRACGVRPGRTHHGGEDGVRVPPGLGGEAESLAARGAAAAAARSGGVELNFGKEEADANLPLSALEDEFGASRIQIQNTVMTSSP